MYVRDREEVGVTRNSQWTEVLTVANCTCNIHYFCFKLISRSSLVTAWSNNNHFGFWYLVCQYQRQSILSYVMFTIHSRTSHLCQVVELESDI